LQALRLSVAAATAFGLSACADKWQRPDLNIAKPAGWIDQRADRPLWPAGDWWSSFGSSELSTLVVEAERANQDIGAAKGRIEQADAQVRINGASLIPVISGDGETSIQRSAGGQRVAGLQTTLNASYELDFWGRNRATVRSAQASAVSARFAEEVVALGVVSDVANVYFAFLAAQERLAIARDNVKSAQTVLDAIQGRLDVGTANGLDVAQQKTIVDQQRATIPPIEQEIRTNQTALALLLGRPPVALQVKGGRLLAQLKTPRVQPGLPSDLLARRPDVRQAEADLAATDADVTAARAAFLPSINLTGQGGFESTALRTLFSGQTALYSLTAGLTQPILDATLPGNLDLAKGQYRENLYAYRKAAIQSFVDTENAIITVRKSAEQEKLQQAATDSARRAYDIARGQLREGAIDIVTMLAVQQSLFSAQDAVVSVRLARYQAYVSMFEALGGGWSSSGRPAGGAPLPEAAIK
jgi:NodT family efflux transporter outer membrane factor (OMF) lipoprotein